MKYPLEDLLRVRRIRKDNASDNVTKAKRLLNEAISFLEQKKKELEDFKRWRLEEIERLYARVIKKDVKREAVDDLHFELASLDNKLLEYEKRVQDAEEKVRQAEKHLEDMKLVLRNAMRDLQKIDEHKAIWRDDYLKLEEEKQEKELEDFKVRDQESNN